MGVLLAGMYLFGRLQFNMLRGSWRRCERKLRWAVWGPSPDSSQNEVQRTARLHSSWWDTRQVSIDFMGECSCEETSRAEEILPCIQERRWQTRECLAEILPMVALERNSGDRWTSSERESQINKGTWSNWAFYLPSHYAWWTGGLPGWHSGNFLQEEYLRRRKSFVLTLLNGAAVELEKKLTQDYLQNSHHWACGKCW